MKFRRRIINEGGTIFMAAVAEDGSIAYSLMVNNMGKQNCQAAYIVHYAEDKEQFEGQGNCDFFATPCSTRLTEMQPYPNYTEGDLWDVIMVKGDVNV